MVIDDIYTEGKAMSSALQDISNFRYKYIIDGIAFDGLKITIFQDYYQYLIANSQYKTLEAKYYYKPEYLSFDEYGTYKFWELLLFVNGCYCLEDFTMSYVYVPYYDAIFEVLKNHIPKSEKEIKLDHLELT